MVGMVMPTCNARVVLGGSDGGRGPRQGRPAAAPDYDFAAPSSC